MRMPTQTAVTGSMAPNTEVSVEPMFLMARTSARLLRSVQIPASPGFPGYPVRDGLLLRLSLFIPVKRRILRQKGKRGISFSAPYSRDFS